MQYIGVLTQNTGISKAKKTSFLIHITVPSFLDADNKKLLYYLQSLTAEHFYFYGVICFYMGSRALLQIILVAFFLFCKYALFLNMPSHYNKFKVNVFGAE